MSGALQGKSTVVTGASSGIGLGIAHRFGAEGARLVMTGRREAELDQAALEVAHGALGVRCDSSSIDDLDRLREIVAERHGALDVLVINAGGGIRGRLEDVSEQSFDSVFATNAKGLFFTMQRLAPILSDGASVILIGSTAASSAAPGSSVYGASKAVARSFARSWMMELAPRGIRVNVLAPGPTLTPGLTGAVAPEQRQARLDGLAAMVPLGRLGDPSEIAAAAVFLASAESSFIDGSELFVDGGQAQQ
jgi:NAD(P)-dependent dehydrogenase (short-subunit alcohol dehydrogenase family)